MEKGGSVVVAAATERSNRFLVHGCKDLDKGDADSDHPARNYHFHYYWVHNDQLRDCWVHTGHCDGFLLQIDPWSDLEDDDCHFDRLCNYDHCHDSHYSCFDQTDSF